jgi:ArsR family transcriptional regulator, arsenate/arsenite/antimonite-responsive transcriptional repressor
MIVNTSVEDHMARAPEIPCCSVLVEPVTDEQAVELAHAFAALADPVRLRLFSMIASAGTACSCNLVEPIGKSQPTVSHHTKVLAEAGLITGEKVGRWVNWTVVPERVAQVRGALSP